MDLYKVELRKPCFAPYVPREVWGARPPTKELDRLIWPATHLHLTSTNTQECRDSKQCLKAIKDIQARDMDDLYRPDIQYSFLVGGDGKLYEGRGPRVEPDRIGDGLGVPRRAIDIAFIGNFCFKVPPSKMLQPARSLIQFLIEQKTLNKRCYVISFMKIKMR